MSIADFDLQKFLDTPIEAFDFQFMIGDVKDFLEFSESNIDWQYRRELQAIANGKDYDDFPHGYRSESNVIRIISARKATAKESKFYS